MAAAFAVLGFVAVLALAVGVRYRLTGGYAVNPTDVFAAGLAVGLGLLASGGLDAVRFSKDGLELKRSVQQAFEKPAPHVAVGTAVPVEKAVAFGKGPVGDPTPEARAVIERVMREGIPALKFRMGEPGHTPEGVAVYLRRLLPVPTFKYVLVVSGEDRLAGFLAADDLARLLLPGAGRVEDTPTVQALVRGLNQADQAALRDIPGVVTDPIRAGTDNKRSALQRLSEPGVSVLPVVDGNGRFVGVADRSRVTASVLLDIADGLDAQGGR